MAEGVFAAVLCNGHRGYNCDGLFQDSMPELTQWVRPCCFLSPRHRMAGAALQAAAPHTGRWDGGTPWEVGKPAHPDRSPATAGDGPSGLEHAEPKFEASFLVPPAGNCLVFLCWPGEGRLSRNFGEGLTVIGNSPEGPFRLFCPRVLYQDRVPDERAARLGGRLPDPPARDRVLRRSPARRHRHRDRQQLRLRSRQPKRYQRPGASEVLRVEAAGRTVDFAWRTGGFISAN